MANPQEIWGNLRLRLPSEISYGILYRDRYLHGLTSPGPRCPPPEGQQLPVFPSYGTIMLQSCQVLQPIAFFASTELY